MKRYFHIIITSLLVAPDDYVALYQLFGFPLLASIITRKPRRWSHHPGRANSVRKRVNCSSIQVRRQRSIQFHILVVN